MSNITEFFKGCLTWSAGHYEVLDSGFVIFLFSSFSFGNLLIIKAFPHSSHLVIGSTSCTLFDILLHMQEGIMHV